MDSKPRFARRSEGNPVALGPSRSAGNGKRVSANGPSAFPIVGKLPLLLALLLPALCGLLPASASARAVLGGVAAEFGPDGTSGSSFGQLGEIAYQQSGDRIYVLADEEISAFEHPSAGTFAPVGGSFPLAVPTASLETDLAVDNSGGSSDGNVYYASNGPQVLGFDSTGAELAGWPVEAAGTACGAAVDSSGHIWVGRSTRTILEFGPAGGPALKAVKVKPTVEVACKLAVDPGTDDLYVPNAYGGPFYRYIATTGYGTAQQLSPYGFFYSRIAVDGARGVIYLGSYYSGELQVLDLATGNLAYTINGVGGVQGLTVDEVTGTLFVASGNGRVKEIPLINVPNATTGGQVGNYGVSGTADPDGAGAITECLFEYGSTTAYGSSVPCDEPTPINAPESVHATLPGLVGEQTYHYRLTLVNAEGTAHGADETITPHPVAGAATGQATQVTRTSATLDGSFEGNGEATTYYFEYGTTSDYGSRIPSAPAEESAGTPVGPAQVSLPLAGLAPGTTYHYRFVASNGEGTSPANDQTFTTLDAVAGVETGEVTGVTKTSAVLNGAFTGNGEAHSYYFEWGTDSSYGHSTAIQSAGSGSGAIAVSAEVTGLEKYLPLSPVYHYRLVVTNAVGSTVGADRSFLTLPPDLPQVTGSTAGEVGESSANLTALVNPGGGPTIYSFEYGRSPAYGFSTPLGDPLGEDESDHLVAATVGGLEPGATYHFRVVATNFAGTTHGADATFTTAAPPSPGPTGGEVSTPPAPTPPSAPRTRCKPGFVKRHGKCVKRGRHHRHHRKRNPNG